MHEGQYRWGLLIVLLLNLSISALLRWRARRESETIARSRERTGLKLLRLGLVLPGLVVILGYSAFPHWGGWPRLPLPDWLRQAGLLLGFFCAAGNWWVLSTLGKNVSETVLTKRDHELVTGGPYRWVRHPLYASGVVLLSSFTLISANLFLLVLTVLVAALFRTIVIPREEAHLEDRFGKRYREYRNRTGALLPRLLPRGQGTSS